MQPMTPRYKTIIRQQMPIIEKVQPLCSFSVVDLEDDLEIEHDEKFEVIWRSLNWFMPMFGLSEAELKELGTCH